MHCIACVNSRAVDDSKIAQQANQVVADILRKHVVDLLEEADLSTLHKVRLGCVLPHQLIVYPLGVGSMEGHISGLE